VGISALATGVAYTLAERDAAPDAAARMTAMMKLAAATAAEQDAKAGKFGLGRPAHPEEVAAWDIDVRPDGTGLPDGSGTVTEGEQVYVEQCAVCHGDFGEGIGRWPELAGGEGTLDSDDPVKTIGSYWPYLSTVYDYIHRAMPFGNAQSLSDDQVYALTAYVLYLNYIVEDMDFELSKENFGDIEMPNEGQFFMDDREQTEFDQFKREPCMTDCKDSVEITKRAQVLDVTPEDEAARKRREEVAGSSGTEEAGGAAKEEETDATADTTAASDPELVAQGRLIQWMRIERYFEETDEEPVEYETTPHRRVTFLPMMCQQCGNAPCEPVCPVYASYHTPDGLNAQVYNRCVGTRYCANNCPYKVRYFNYFTYEWPEPLNWQLNPDVTVREKGIMEKCTFCVQRIRHAEHEARVDGRTVADGEIQPACAQTCPGNAIVFGNIKDPSSRVARVVESNRGFRVFEELNTQSAVVYLKRVTEDGEAH
ncbi:MAG: c-type cytochrome, partial [Gemmatimonadota bacterium]